MRERESHVVTMPDEDRLRQEADELNYQRRQEEKMPNIGTRRITTGLDFAAGFGWVLPQELLRPSELNTDRKSTPRMYGWHTTSKSEHSGASNAAEMGISVLTLRINSLFFFYRRMPPKRKRGERKEGGATPRSTAGSAVSAQLLNQPEPRTAGIAPAPPDVRHSTERETPMTTKTLQAGVKIAVERTYSMINTESSFQAMDEFLKLEMPQVNTIVRHAVIFAQQNYRRIWKEGSQVQQPQDLVEKDVPRLLDQREEKVTATPRSSSCSSSCTTSDTGSSTGTEDEAEQKDSRIAELTRRPLSPTFRFVDLAATGTSEDIAAAPTGPAKLLSPQETKKRKEKKTRTSPRRRTESRIVSAAAGAPGQLPSTVEIREKPKDHTKSAKSRSHYSSESGGATQSTMRRYTTVDPNNNESIGKTLHRGESERDPQFTKEHEETPPSRARSRSPRLSDRYPRHRRTQKGPTPTPRGPSGSRGERRHSASAESTCRLRARSASSPRGHHSFEGRDRPSSRDGRRSRDCYRPMDSRSNWQRRRAAPQPRGMYHRETFRSPIVRRRQQEESHISQSDLARIINETVNESVRKALRGLHKGESRPYH